VEFRREKDEVRPSISTLINGTARIVSKASDSHLHITVGTIFMTHSIGGCFVAN